MIGIKTPVGYLYMEEENSREEADRIKIYDSRKRYIEYFAVGGDFPISKIIAFIEADLKKCRSIRQLIAVLGLEAIKYSKDWKKIAREAYDGTLINTEDGGCYNILTREKINEEDLLENEYVNVVGDTYILIFE